jgi:hypothetical protein
VTDSRRKKRVFSVLLTAYEPTYSWARSDEKFCKIVEWLSSADMSKKQADVFARHHENTGSWLLEHPQFKNWLHENNSEKEHEKERTLWCYGDRKLATLLIKKGSQLIRPSWSWENSHDVS